MQIVKIQKFQLVIQNGQIHVYFINMYVKIYPNESGYNYYYKECVFISDFE